MSKIFFVFKRIRYFIEGLLDQLFDGFSVRLCFTCHKKQADPLNNFFCESCFKELDLDFSKTQKEINFSEAELNFLFGQEDFTHPKIYYAYFYDDKIKFFVREFKYRRPYYAFFAGSLLKDYFLKNKNYIIADISADFYGRAVVRSSPKPLKVWVSYMPMYKFKYYKRSYNQAKLLAYKFFSELKLEITQNSFECFYQSASGLTNNPVTEIEFIEDLFVRSKNTANLYEKNRQERIEIMSESISINPDLDINISSDDENIFLVFDDIVTTGASFISCHRAFLGSKFSRYDIFYIALAGNN